MNKAVSFKMLWKLLIDKGMKKCDLERRAENTHYGAFYFSHSEASDQRSCSVHKISATKQAAELTEE